MSASNNNDEPTAEGAGKFSLHSLSAAFARLTGNSPEESEPAASEEDEGDVGSDSSHSGAETLSPRMIVEGMLFVGKTDGQPLASREIATHIRDVSPREVETLIDELNESYQRDGTAYRIVSEGKGYRYDLDRQYEFIRQRFHGRTRQAKLSTAAIEVLSIVAYRQPIDTKQIDTLRGGRSATLLSQLVRRGLLRLVRPEATPRQPLYQTTERFNTLFGIGSPADLPSSEDLDDR